jgi:hypothetical protein
MTARARSSSGIFNDIPSRQNSPRMMELLRAKSERYDRARKLFGIEVALTVVGPGLVVVLGLLDAKFLPYAAVYGFLAMVIGIALERLQEAATIEGAKLQELFDVELYGLEWNQQERGDKPAPEDIAEWARRYPASKDLRDWYARDVQKLPIQLARIACQRSNGWWDSRMRRRYGFFLIGGAVCAALVVMLGAVLSDGNMITVFEVLFALSSIFSLSVRHAMKQLDIAGEREQLQARAEEIWRDALRGRLIDKDLDEASRDLQSKLYAQRRQNAPVPTWFYSKFRDTSEKAMRVGVRQLVEDFERV